MGGEGDEGNAALEELRQRLSDALASSALDKSLLARRAGLGRTTVSEAFQPGAVVPSARTVAALAQALGLPKGELLKLRRTAAGETGPVQVPDEGLGKPIGQWDPHDLEVHPAGTAAVVASSDTRGRRVLPGYVHRAHDQVLTETVGEVMRGRSRMLVLVGSSSTGKTRACWEAVQTLAADGWRLWHPYDPARAEAALADLSRVAPRTVVWLNEAQHYLGHPQAGERIAAALHTLLTSAERGPVLVLGTLWPEYVRRYTAMPTLPSPEGEDPHSRVRELLDGRTVNVPDTFDTRALAEAAALAKGGDRLLADALTRVSDNGRLTQDLAGAPALLNRYRTGGAAAKALLEVAMDARRLGVGLHLPQIFLTDAAADYLTDTDWDQLQLTDDWAEKAYAELAERVHGKQAPLSRVTPRPQRRPPGPSTSADALSSCPIEPVFRLADYLEQHGRTTRRRLCPPASFWHAAHTHLTRPDDLYNLTQAAIDRHRLQWAHHLLHRAAAHDSPDALYRLAATRERTGDWKGAETLLRQAADHGSTKALNHLAARRELARDLEGAEILYQQAADQGDTIALYHLIGSRERAGDWEGAETLLRQAADHGIPWALARMAKRS